MLIDFSIFFINKNLHTKFKINPIDRWLNRSYTIWNKCKSNNHSTRVSFTDKLSLKSRQSQREPLNDTKRPTDRQVKNFLRYLAKYHKTFLRLVIRLLFYILDDHKILHTRQPRLSFQVQYIRLHLIVPFCLLIYILFYTMVAFLRVKLLQSLVAVILYWLVLRNEYAHLSRTFQSQDVCLVADCSSNLLRLWRFGFCWLLVGFWDVL